MDILFIFKKLIAVLVMPLSLSILTLLLGLLLIKHKVSTKFFVASFFLLFISSFNPVADRLMHQLENQYEAFRLSPEPVDYIVILGCGHQTNDALSATSQLKPCSLQRLVEGVRIFRLHPEAKLVTSGYGLANDAPNAEKVKQAAIALGVPSNKILTEPYPKDTQEEAELISSRVKGKNVVLVTDAYHLPRAMGYFQMNGVNATPAPAGYYVKNINAEHNLLYYFPSVYALQKSSIIWYEYMGQLHQWIQRLVKLTRTSLCK